LIFTVEKAGDTAQPYQLTPSGRYRHAEQYVRDGLAQAMLDLIDLEHVVLRRERGSEVSGLLVSARRPASTPTT
jgi:predicted TPR repeat methyltransferase